VGCYITVNLVLNTGNRAVLRLWIQEVITDFICSSDGENKECVCRILVGKTSHGCLRLNGGSNLWGHTVAVEILRQTSDICKVELLRKLLYVHVLLTSERAFGGDIHVLLRLAILLLWQDEWIPAQNNKFRVMKPSGCLGVADLFLLRQDGGRSCLCAYGSGTLAWRMLICYEMTRHLCAHTVV
jgi:hypothetical protein